MVRRVFIALLCVMLSVSFVFAGGSAESTQNALREDPRFQSLLDAYADIEPLENPATVRYIATVGLQLSSPLWIAYESGCLEDAGITLDFIPASTGPLSIEALNAGEVDLVGTGIAGVAVGAVQGTSKVLCYINDDSVVQKFFVKDTNPLASTSFNEETGFYGTADDWRGVEVYLPAGTTLQYLLGFALDKLGLTLQDVKTIYMDANNVNTAMYANQGEVWGIWNFLCYSAALEEEGYKAVIEGGPAGINLVTAFMTNDEVLSDADKNAAIMKILEYHFATEQWMHESEDNMQFAAEIIAKWCEDEGAVTSVDEMFAYLSETKYYTIDENYEMFTTQVSTANGEMSEAMARLQGIMDFYVSQGNYTAQDHETMIENDSRIFTMEGIDTVMENQ